MIHFLMNMLSHVRQPVVELIMQVTLWSLLGVIIYSCFRRVAYSNRHILLGFCLGTMALSFLILLPLHIWSPPLWPDNSSGAPSPWKVRQIFDVSAEVPDMAQLYQQHERALEQPSAAMMNGETWLMLLLFLLGAFVVVSSLRLLLGLLAMEHWRRSSKAVDDFELHQLLDELRLAMGIRQSVSLRVTTSLGSPATVGWWRPTILLPASWRQWSLPEQRAVLAHELAHVRNSDYPLWLLVQLAAAVHAYHPLVRWLVHRLQGELELAADRLAAPQAGGDADYMRSLCRLALQHGSCGAGHVALALLPVHLPLSWRMTMLRSGNLTARVPRMWSQLLFGCGLVAVAVLIAGLRGPVKAEEPKATLQPPVRKPTVKPALSEPTDEITPCVTLQLKLLEVNQEVLSKLKFSEEESLSAKKSVVVKLVDKNQNWSKSLTESSGAKVLLCPQIMTRSGRPARIEIGPDSILSSDDIHKNRFKSLGLDPNNTPGIIESTRKQGDGFIISCLAVVKPDGGLRLTLSEEIYFSTDQELMKKVETKPSVTVGTTLELRFDQTACIVTPASKITSENKVIVTLVQPSLQQKGPRPIQDESKKMEEK